jgi:hypothetical protein
MNSMLGVNKYTNIIDHLTFNGLSAVLHQVHSQSVLRYFSALIWPTWHTLNGGISEQRGFEPD